MDLFQLPRTTILNRFVPKSVFDDYTTTKQKKSFTEKISKITWTHKISPETVNLSCKDIREIQIFNVILKSKIDVKELLDIIDKVIPYHIIFVIEFDDQIYLSTSVKHLHPLKEDNAVIDWTFCTDWLLPEENKCKIKLKKNLDTVYYDFCIQLSGIPKISRDNSLKSLVEHSKEISSLQKEMERLKVALSHCRQYNLKVELNIKLKGVEKKLKYLLGNH